MFIPVLFCFEYGSLKGPTHCWRLTWTLEVLQFWALNYPTEAEAESLPARMKKTKCVLIAHKSAIPVKGRLGQS